MKTRLKELRKAAGYQTADEFARKMGLSVHTYRKYEQGVIDLYLDTACEFAEVLGCTLEELLGRSETSYAVVHLPDECDELCDIYGALTEEGKRQLMIFARGLLATFPENRGLSEEIA